jgi:hypothetical protein
MTGPRTTGPRDRFADPSRPWGWWLGTDREGRIVGERGETYQSVREALWEGRFGLAADDEREAAVEMERLLGFLVSISRRTSSRRERLIEIYEDEPRMTYFHGMWARGQGLIDEDGRLTDEGNAVMLMLAVTRDFEKGFVPVGDDEVPVGSGKAEAFGRRNGWCFERAMVGSLFALSLSGRVSPRALPQQAVVWTHVFHDEQCRDAMFEWICLRVDRWRDWGEATSRFGSAWLTDHLFTLIACGMAEAAGAA